MHLLLVDYTVLQCSIVGGGHITIPLPPDPALEVSARCQSTVLHRLTPVIPFKQKSQYFSKTFFFYTTNLDNKLAPQLRKNHDILEFKSKLKEKYKDTKVRHFDRGISKLSNSLHTQLRLGRSFLAAHGYAIGLNNSDLRLCWRPETTKLFFWDCFLFQEERTKLFYYKF